MVAMGAAALPDALAAALAAATAIGMRRGGRRGRGRCAVTCKGSYTGESDGEAGDPPDRALPLLTQHPASGREAARGSNACHRGARAPRAAHQQGAAFVTKHARKLSNQSPHIHTSVQHPVRKVGDRRVDTRRTEP